MGLGNEARALIQQGVDEQKEFKKGNLKGIKIKREDTLDFGRLPEEYRKQLRQQHEFDMVKYMIFSYGTPIAWVLYAGTWICPEVNYSITTTHHQGVVKTAIGNPGFWDNRF